MREFTNNLAGKSIVKNENILWVKDSVGILVIDSQRKIYWLLVGFEENLWQLMALNYPFEYIVNVAERNLGISKEVSPDIIAEHIGRWVENGIFRICEP